MQRLSVIISLAIFFSSCAAPAQVSVNTPQGNKSVYPPVYQDSAAREQAVQEAWRALLAEANIQFIKLDLEPALNTPKSLPAALAGSINITKKSGEFGAMEAKEALRSWIERTRGILSGDPANSSINLKDLSLRSFTDDGNFYRASYKQVSYTYPIVDGFGDLKISVDKKAMLLQLSSRLIPVVNMPAGPEIKSQDIIDRLTNRELNYTNIAGQPQTYRVTNRNEIEVKDLVIYPKVAGNKVAIHLAYAVNVGKGTTWTVYIDAINGEELGMKQNFAS